MGHLTIHSAKRLLEALDIAVPNRDPELPPEQVAAAWARYGAAIRDAGLLHEWMVAELLPSSDPEPESPLALEKDARLYRHRRDFKNAAELLLAAIKLYRSNRDSIRESRAWRQLGNVLRDLGDQPSALLAFRTSLDRLGPRAPLDLVVITGHSLLEALIADGRLAAAESALALLEPFYDQMDSPYWLAKAEWARARLCRDLRQLPEARQAYERAYALEAANPLSRELPTLLQEMAALKAAMNPRQE